MTSVTRPSLPCFYRLFTCSFPTFALKVLSSVSPVLCLTHDLFINFFSFIRIPFVIYSFIHPVLRPCPAPATSATTQLPDPRLHPALSLFPHLLSLSLTVTSCKVDDPANVWLVSTTTPPLPSPSRGPGAVTAGSNVCSRSNHLISLSGKTISRPLPTHQ